MDNLTTAPTRGPFLSSTTIRAKKLWALAHSGAARLILTSFAILFFELICIRWIPAYVRYLSYFSNFVLLATFLGVGLGILSARRARFWLPPFAMLLLGIVGLVAINRFELQIRSTDVLYWGTGRKVAAEETYWTLPLMFSAITVAFVPLGRTLGQLLRALPPLRAYALDVLGSLLGIVCFFVLSLLSLPPIIWFAVLAVSLLPILSRRGVLVALPLMAATLFLVWRMGIGSFWSPYYRIQLLPARGSGYVINVNNTGHQTMQHWPIKEPFYRKVYDLFSSSTFDNALIIGAGGGSDVATALAHDVRQIDAVEIDPTILRLGHQLNPDHPYNDPRVSLYLDDGRAFLRRSTQRYDLIIFGLPDSLTLTSGFSSLRLESFLLTEDAIESARAHLSDDGVLVLYNYYRETWLIEKLASMMQTAFGAPPFVITYGGWGRAAVLMAGPRVAHLAPDLRKPYTEAGNTDKWLAITGTGMLPGGSLPVPTDDWPFLYLQQPSLPWIYVGSLLLVATLALMAIVTVAPRGTLRRFDWHFFALGAAFMLLETRSLVVFALLFGSTWLVNSLVFFAILCSVLLAILFNARVRIRRVRWLYNLLGLMLALNYLIPADRLLVDNPLVRYLVAATFVFAPIFLANVVFSHAFRDTESADLAFASNLFGIMVGGMLEYTSLLFGYRFVLLLAILLYGLAFVLRRLKRASEDPLAAHR